MPLTALNSFFDIIFSPLLYLGTFWAVLIISLLLSVIITVIYKYTTDQNLMKQLKDEIKDLQKQSKELQNHPEKFKEVQSKMMKTNMKVMSESLKPMLYYFLPIIFIFGWMSTNLYFHPLTANEEFSIDVYAKNVSLTNYEGLNLIENKMISVNGGEVNRFSFKGNYGDYLVLLNADGKEIKKRVLIDQKKYNTPEEKINEIKILTSNKPVILLNLGFTQLGWLGVYIISSVIFSSLLRKLMKVY
ncbi:DUF106 domain-containing protein [Candidatus Woesearchaeota archaeon]|nr:DUF106 domain-containing protein [Candidatus Woesearchaeota archaeon]